MLWFSPFDLGRRPKKEKKNAALILPRDNYKIQKRLFRIRAQAMAATAAPPRCADPEMLESPCNDEQKYYISSLKQVYVVGQQEEEDWSSQAPRQPLVLSLIGRVLT